MGNYIGCKIIKAEKVTFGEYIKAKHGKDFEYKGNMPLDKEVYMIIYPPIGEEEKPYISMSPVEVFEKAYRKIDKAEYNIMLSKDPLNPLDDNK